MDSAWVTCATDEPIDWASFTAWRASQRRTNGQSMHGPVVLGLSIAGLPPPPDQLLASLTAAEHQRADRFRQPADRLRFLYGRVFLRWAGAGLTRRDARAVGLLIGPTGKPELAESMGWHVSLAHAGDWVLLAADRQPVGVDVEWYRPGLAVDTLLASTCSPAEQRYVQIDASPPAAFLRLWTRKEALLKATGRGLTDALPQVPSLDGRAAVPPTIIGAGGDWQVRSFQVDTAHPAALACRPETRPYAFCTLSASDLLTNGWTA